MKLVEVKTDRAYVLSEGRRLEYLLFTEPVIHLSAAILVRRETEGSLTEEDLIGKRVAVVSGYAMHEYLETNFPEIELVLVPNTLEGLRQVSFGSVDAMVGDDATASHFIEASGISNLR